MQCRKCGAELDGTPTVCPSCGRDPTKRGGKGRLLVLVIGIMLLVIAVLLMVGGVFLVTLGSGLADSEGYRWSSTHEIVVDSHAGVLAGFEDDPEEDLPPFLWIISPKNLSTIKFRVVGPPSSKELFVGMARHDDAMAYFDKVPFHIARDWDWRMSPWNISLEIDEMVLFKGSVEPQAPKEATVWAASAWGIQTAVLDWTPQKGTYWVAIMNADGSPGVEASIELGVRFPILGRLFTIMLILGLVLGAGGTLLIFFGYMRRR